MRAKAEQFCPAFIDAVPCLLEGSTPVIMTTALKGGGLIEEGKARTDVYLLRVSAENRDSLPGILERGFLAGAAWGSSSRRGSSQ